MLHTDGLFENTAYDSSMRRPQNKKRASGNSEAHGVLYE